LIKFNGLFRGVPTLGLALSEENIQRLKKGEPIHIDVREMDFPYDLQILLFAGETEESIVADFKANGIITENTPMHTFSEH
jgi:hypothetical protein